VLRPAYCYSVMIDLHPPSSGLPLASALLLCVAEMLRCVPRARAVSSVLRTTAVVACAVAVIAAFVSGYQASSRAVALAPHVESAMGWHHSLGKGLLATSLLLATFYYLSRVATHGARIVSALYYLVVVIHVALTVWVGTLGGQLVFAHGVNVSRPANF
jgi:uncharacterized membrane protein